MLSAALLLFLVGACSAQVNDMTYWVTFPKVMRPGLPFTIKYNLMGASSSAKLTASVWYNIYVDRKQEKHILTEAPGWTITPGGIKTIEWQVPRDLKIPERGYSFQIIMEAQGPDVFFNGTGDIRIEQKSFSTFIQTDKAMYKPGQTVKFRVANMDPDMKIMNDPMDIFLEDSKGNRIEQWLGVNDPDGFGVVERSFRLANRVPTGDWQIKVEALGKSEMKEFEVKEYVLPRFEVTVEPPSIVLTTSPLIPIKVRAKYTFGQPVTDGTARLVIKSNSYYGSDHKDNPLVHEAKLDPLGEADFMIEQDEFIKLVSRDYPESDASYYLNWRQFTVIANVTERHSGRTMSEDTVISFKRSDLKMTYLSISPDSFKPGLKYTGYLEVNKVDDTNFSPAEAANLPVYINITYNVRKEEPSTTTTTTTEAPSSDLEKRPIWTGGGGFWPRHNFETHNLQAYTAKIPDNGWIILNFTVPSEAYDVTINASVHRPQDYPMIKTLMKAESPSNSYLQLSISTDEVEVGRMAEFTAKATENIQSLSYQVIAKGMLMISETINMPSPSTEVTFSVYVTRSLAPGMKVIAWYVRADGEFVPDGLSLNVKNVFNNPVSLSFDQEKVKPGENVTLTVNGEEGSRFYLLSVDKSVKLLKGGNDITQKDVLDDLAKYDFSVGFYGQWRFMFICGWPWSISGQDAAQVFDNAELNILTDGTVYSKPPEYSPLPEFAVPNEDRLDTATGAKAPREVAKVRKIFPETWLWKFSLIDAGGSTELQVTAPDTITSWITSVFSISPTKGLSIAKEPVSLTVFRDMFVSLDLPLSIIRGEDYCFTASVFSYYDGLIPVMLTLKRNPGFENIRVKRKTPNNANDLETEKEQVNYAYYLPRLKKNDVGSAMFCITPTVLGDITIEVHATSTAIPGDAVQRVLHVKPEGKPRAVNKPFLVDLSSRAFTTIVDTVFPSNAVDGSQSLTVGIAGNVIGPMIENLDDLLKMPYGCAEQNMLNFAPNIYVLQFFYASSRLTSEILDKTREHLVVGYQKEITYEHSGGGYSTFGSNKDTTHSPSMWLTAFVIRCFSQASLLNKQHPEDKLVNIDSDLIWRSVTWMSEHQKGGAFSEPGKVFNKRMQGGSANGEALTAYVLITLVETRNAITVPDAQKLGDMISDATRFVEANFNSLTDPYDICISTYALNLAGSSMAFTAFQRMKDIALVGDGLMYWERPKRPEDERTKYFYTATTDAINIEMSAYALLTFALRGETSEALLIVRYLSNHRGANGGFISTQDTVVGVQALTSIAALMNEDSDIPATITLTYDEMPGLTRSIQFTVDSDNEMVFQRADIKVENGSPSSLTISASSAESRTSALIAEVVMRYNEGDDTLPEVFNMDINIMEENDQVKLEICATRNDGASSGMTVLKVEVPAGYIFDASSDQTSSIEEEAEHVNFYFDAEMIDFRAKCVRILFMRTENTLVKEMPREVTIYDYYEPDQSLTKYFMIGKNDAPFCSKVDKYGLCRFADKKVKEMNQR